MRNALRRLPIRTKISFLIMLTTVSTLLGAFTAMIILSYHYEREEIGDKLDTFAQVLAENTAASLLFKDHETSRAILSGLHANPSIVGAAIYWNNGTPFVTYGSVSPGPLAATRRSGKKLVESYRPIKLRGEVLGTLYIASDLRDLREATRMQITTGLAILAVALIVALLMAAGLRRLVTRPLITLGAAAQRVIREKSYCVRVEEDDVREDDELFRVMLAFNEMLSQIESRDEMLRRHQADLESEVQIRTSELVTANEELRLAMDFAELSANESAELSRNNEMILNAAGEGIFGIDLAGNVTFINPSAEHILACTSKNMTGTNLHARIHFTDGHEASQTVDECSVCGPTLTTPMRARCETFFRGCDGRRIPIEYTSSTLIDDKGRATGVVVTFRDITERLAIERMKDEFVSTVSHELRTPLTSIRGALGLLGSGLIGSPSPKAQRMLDIALANTDRLGRLINDILDLEKMTAGRVELNRKVLSGHELIKQAVEAMLPMADRAEVKILVRASAAPILADADRFLQMLLNLLSNAIKFSPANTIVRVTGTVKNGEYVVSVRDQGRGVPADKLEMIFERFKQVDASDSRDKGGTGLGLAICRAIAEAQGGKIWAERAEPQGTILTFTVPMPYAECASGQNVESPTWTPAATREAVDVLLIEDDADLSRVTIAALEANGIRTAYASTGREAIAALERFAPSLIILDIVLPDLDGFAIVDWLHRNTTMHDVPLLVYSAQEVGSADQERLRLGPTQFLTKSRVSMDEFQQRVIRLLSPVPAGAIDAA